MKYSQLLSLICLACLPVAISATSGVKLTVSLEGGKPGEGVYVVGLFDAEDKWLTEVKREMRVPVDENGTAAVSFDALPIGTYAISTYQDRNENGKIDTNLLGIPKEPYAFSNEARGRFGPAKFKDAAFEVNGEDQTVTIRYP